MELLANMFSLAPGDKDHEAAARCAVGVFVPLITLVLLDRVDLAIFASFGAFTGIYGRNTRHRVGRGGHCRGAGADRLAAAEGPPGHSARRRLTG